MLGMNWHLCSLGVLDCWSSAHRSLIAVTELSLLTDELMHKFLRDPRVKCFTSSARSGASPVASWGIAGGKSTLLSSLMNCVSWECVREQKKI